MPDDTTSHDSPTPMTVERLLGYFPQIGMAAARVSETRGVSVTITHAVERPLSGIGGNVAYTVTFETPDERGEVSFFDYKIGNVEEMAAEIAHSLRSKADVLARADALLRDVTTDPWEWDDSWMPNTLRSVDGTHRVIYTSGDNHGGSVLYILPEDAAFIAQAPQLVRDLLAEVRRLRGLVPKAETPFIERLETMTIGDVRQALINGVMTGEQLNSAMGMIGRMIPIEPNLWASFLGGFTAEMPALRVLRGLVR